MAKFKLGPGKAPQKPQVALQEPVIQASAPQVQVVEKIVERIVEKPVEVIKEVIKEVRVEVPKIIHKTKIVEKKVPVEVIKEVRVEVPVEKQVVREVVKLKFSNKTPRLVKALLVLQSLIILGLLVSH